MSKGNVERSPLTIAAKRHRLERLAEVADNVPRTFWSGHAFVAAAASDESRWCVRTRESVSSPLNALTPDEARSYLKAADRDVVIQEFIAPQFSGVTFVALPYILCEATPGPCQGILREGSRGLRWASSRSGIVEWTTGTGLSMVQLRAVSTLLARQLELLQLNSTRYIRDT